MTESVAEFLRLYAIMFVAMEFIASPMTISGALAKLREDVHPLVHVAFAASAASNAFISNAPYVARLALSIPAALLAMMLWLYLERRDHRVKLPRATMRVAR